MKKKKNPPGIRDDCVFNPLGIVFECRYVSIAWSGSRSTVGKSCDTLSYGEVEDYTVTIL